MASISAVDEKSARKFYLDDPDDLRPSEEPTFLLNLHGGGSVGHWQRLYFPAFDYRERYRLGRGHPVRCDEGALAALGRECRSRPPAEHRSTRVREVRQREHWLVGHSQGGMTSNRLLGQDFFKDRVDGWLSLSGGPARHGTARHGTARPWSTSFQTRVTTASLAPWMDWPSAEPPHLLNSRCRR